MRITEAMLKSRKFPADRDGKVFRRQDPRGNYFGRTFSGSVVVIVLIIGLTTWMYLARIVRAEFLSIKENEFVLAATRHRHPNIEIIFRHILPNSIAPIVVSATLGVANAILPKRISASLGWGSDRRPPPGAICWKAQTITLRPPPGCGFSRVC